MRFHGQHLFICNGMAVSHDGQEQNLGARLHGLESSSVSTYLNDFEQTEWPQVPLFIASPLTWKQ